MALDSDRCHFCGNWTRDYKRIGDRSVCKDCWKELVEKLKEDLD